MTLLASSCLSTSFMKTTLSNSRNDINVEDDSNPGNRSGRVGEFRRNEVEPRKFGDRHMTRTNVEKDRDERRRRRRF